MKTTKDVTTQLDRHLIAGVVGFSTGNTCLFGRKSDNVVAYSLQEDNRHYEKR